MSGADRTRWPHRARATAAASGGARDARVTPVTVPAPHARPDRAGAWRAKRSGAPGDTFLGATLLLDGGPEPLGGDEAVPIVGRGVTSREEAGLGAALELRAARAPPGDDAFWVVGCRAARGTVGGEITTCWSVHNDVLVLRLLDGREHLVRGGARVDVPEASRHRGRSANRWINGDRCSRSMLHALPAVVRLAPRRRRCNGRPLSLRFSTRDRRSRAQVDTRLRGGAGCDARGSVGGATAAA
jgi:hypothetical protein